MVDKTQPTEILSADEFQAIRRKLGLSVPELTKLLNISTARTIRRWEDGAVPVSGPATVLMHAMLEVPGVCEYLQEMARHRND